jgi:hypothetical protein
MAQSDKMTQKPYLSSKLYQLGEINAALEMLKYTPVNEVKY